MARFIRNNPIATLNAYVLLEKLKMDGTGKEKRRLSDFPLDADHRKFNISWYKRKCAGINEVDRHWLVYSPKCSRLFCFCCWLLADKNVFLADKNADSYSKTWGNAECGMANFTKGIEKIIKHEKSVIHIDAQKRYFMTKYRLDANKTVINDLIREEKKRVEQNRKVLKRLIDCRAYIISGETRPSL